MDEQSAIALLKAGNPGGLETLVKAYQHIAVGAAYLIVRDRAQAEDIVQTAFLRVYERIEQFEADRPFRPWFLRIVVNDAVKSVTRQNRHLSLDDDSTCSQSRLLERLVDSRPSPENEAESAEIRRNVWAALEALSPEQRAAVVMHYYLDMSAAEISQQTKSPPGTVKWRLHTARKHLHRLLRYALLD
jgi:RNA polymerase sigma-70 factor (ECF subfamily)